MSLCEIVVSGLRIAEMSAMLDTEYKVLTYFASSSNMLLILYTLEG